MTDTVSLVLRFVENHPQCTLARIQEDLRDENDRRRPFQEIEHAVGSLKREGKILQERPGIWVLRKPIPIEGTKAEFSATRASRKPRPGIPREKHRCPRCMVIKRRSEFYHSGYCRPCGRAKSIEDNVRRTAKRRAMAGVAA